VLAISAGGGHWEQLLLLRDGLARCDVTYAVTIRALAEREGLEAVEVPDFNAHRPIATMLGILRIAAFVLRLRPDAVISTGAAPGAVALVVGKLIGARTVWVDSVANAERLSLSGRLCGRFADLWLTQWEHLATADGPAYCGSVL
jgi:UDP-N-acetylglucosamine:LPS N-acetylglucosamine transferase